MTLFNIISALQQQLGLLLFYYQTQGARASKQAAVLTGTRPPGEENLCFEKCPMHTAVRSKPQSSSHNPQSGCVFET